MPGGRAPSNGTSQNVEKGRELRSPSVGFLTYFFVRSGSSLSAALLGNLFEHPEGIWFHG